jgi:DNA-binding winged helix-turn-helix (wHTH) protein
MESMNWGALQKQRPGGSEGDEGQTGSGARFVCFGDFQLDMQREELFKNGSRVKLQGKVFQVLAVLLEQHGEIVTREAISSRLWADSSHVNFDANVNTTVNKLRQVLGDSPDRPMFVETVPRRGYSFIAKVEFVNALSKENSMLQETARHSARSGGLGASQLLSRDPSQSRVWFTLGIITLIVAGILLGAAIAVYAHRAIW